MTLKIYNYQTKEIEGRTFVSNKTDYEQVAENLFKEEGFDIDTMGIFVCSNFGEIVAIIEFEKRPLGTYMVIDDCSRFEYREKRVK